MKKKLLNILIFVFLVIALIFWHEKIFYFFKDHFFTLETLYLYLIGIPIIGIIWLLHWFHSTLIRKNKIEWIYYPDLRRMSGWIYVFACLFSLFNIIMLIMVFIGKCNFQPWMIGSITITIFTSWAYFSLVFGSSHALFILRSFFLFVIFYSLFLIFSLCSIIPDMPLWIIIGKCLANRQIDTELLYDFSGFLFDICFIIFYISFDIKGLLLLYSPQNRYAFKDGVPPIYIIGLVVFLTLSMIIGYGLGVSGIKSKNEEISYVSSYKVHNYSIEIIEYNGIPYSGKIQDNSNGYLKV